MRFVILMLLVALPLMANAARGTGRYKISAKKARAAKVAAAKPVKKCYTYSSRKSFNANDKSLPLLCITSNANKTQTINVQKRVGKFGIGESEYVAKLKYNPKSRAHNKNSYRLMNVYYDSPYLVFNGKKAYGRESGYIVFRGEGFFYKATDRKI